MKIGLSVADFTWPSGPAKLGDELAAVAKAADRGGFDTLWVMDHFFQIRYNGPAENDMLEGYTTLGYLAGVTDRVKLGTLVTGVHYRHPGLLVKIVTTLDVLSGGRAVLGIGAGWNEEESRGLGVPFPTTKERFEQLEETLQIALQMWRGDEKPYAGGHFQLERPMNSPQVLQKPHPPILIGGSGEKKTLRLVAQYGDACNIFPGPDLARKLDVLRGHCDAVGRDYDEIQKTTAFQVPDDPDDAALDKLTETFAEFAKLGIDAVHLATTPAHRTDIVERIGERVIPVVADL
ncbi:LLM class F420-dependent oxidoreductase [Fodinicola acaciae]|uniref:LLM class F420-dependent oxidoreductase n=1 Tax=Fodinicola acaciae TaxID=2681555 RepID=UPI0013D46466|nr:LLM class F420-dependent oxidoreductase [Fodinicola acaciae]